MARAISAQPYYTLDEYRKDVYQPACLFNGVEGSGEAVSGCDHCWMQWEREMVAQALYDAEQMLKQYLRFPIGQEYLTDLDLAWTDPMTLNWGHIIGAGEQALTAITPSASNFAVDPATITVAQADFPGGAGEILIVETATGLQIVPDSITATGANYQIEINQCKLIEWDDLEDQSACIDYDNTFSATIWLKLADLTVYREYLDDSDQATITFAPSCDCYTCLGTACEGDEYTGCVYTLDEEISKVRIALADYSAGSWTCTYPTLYGCYHGSKVAVNYSAGHEPVGWKRAVRSLAHTYMDVEPCGCTLFRQLVVRDQRYPPVLTAERVNCPLGIYDGAWYAWQWLQNVKNGMAIMG